MHWKLKAQIQRVLSVVPAGDQLHYLLQRNLGGLRNFKGELDIKIEDWKIMLARLGECGVSVAGKRMFEIGSGWYPTFPLACYLGGATRITTVDLKRHMKPDLLLACAEHLGRWTALVCEAVGIDEAAVKLRHARLLESLRNGIDLATATEGVVDYRAPMDATHTDIEAGQIDCIFSNSVLEHVPPQIIDAMYVEAMRILDDNGVMFHSVNCGDHYAYIDRSIHQLHYLRYSDAEWSKWNNAFLYQNRMRAHEFVERAQAAGFRIELNTAKAHELRLAQLASTPVHEQFSEIPAQKLCITSVDFIARKQARSAAPTMQHPVS